MLHITEIHQPKILGRVEAPVATMLLSCLPQLPHAKGVLGAVDSFAFALW